MLRIGEYSVDGRIFPENQYHFAKDFAKRLAEDEDRTVVILQGDVFDGDFSTRLVETVKPPSKEKR